MSACLEMAAMAARTDLPILILGESGTGKTVLARAIHNSSHRATGAFVSFNAAALSDSLLDSQLFGHEKGAFTGAEHRVKGKFELADGGTLLIDEIAEMSSAAQAKILRAVEYGEFERLGSETLQVANVRLISATLLPLEQFVNSMRFRHDLLHRIKGIAITIPPLRERTSDLPLLIAAEIAAACQLEGKKIIGLDKCSTDLLLSYHWPGNLRELRRMIHAAVALSKDEIIPPEVIFITKVEPSPECGGDSQEAKAAPGCKDLRLKTAEKKHIREVLNKMGGNKRQAAKALGLSRSTLDRKLTGE
jgi:transcriptional regulator with PAS, ATPase and Fis domain